jgi:hypothetical protein
MNFVPVQETTKLCKNKINLCILEVNNPNGEVNRSVAFPILKDNKIPSNI